MVDFHKIKTNCKRQMDEMDPSVFLPYLPPPNGLPQESKLATYMNRSTPTSTRSLSHTLSKLSLDSSPPEIKPVLTAEFVPLTYYPPPNILPESPHSSPPNVLPISIPQTHTQVHQENVGGTTYFYSTSTPHTDDFNTSAVLNAAAAIVGCPQYGGAEACMAPPVLPVTVGVSPYASQMYARNPTPPNVGPMVPIPPTPGLAPSFYMPETIKSEIYERNKHVFLETNLNKYPELPDSVGSYTQLTPIEDPLPHSMATTFRVTHRQNGDYYTLRRLHSYVGVPNCNKRLDMWKQIDHPNIVRLYECFTTKAFGDHSYVLVYDYHPGAETIMDKYLVTGVTGNAGEPNGAFHDPFSSDPDAPRPYTHQKNAMLRAVACGALLPEAVLWSLLVQLTAAMRAVHNSGLACRSLDPTKVLMNGCRVRFTFCGIIDALHTNTNDVGPAQQEDLTALGRLALSLACRTMHCDNLPASLDLISRTYSPDFKNVILYLLSNPASRRSVTDLMPMIGARFYTQVEALQRRADAFEDQLANEVDNGRLLRIMIKLGIVNERPNQWSTGTAPAWALGAGQNSASTSGRTPESKWSETGDRYMLKLFRDYLFHTVASDGRPWIDQAHMVNCLNQLDGGSSTKIELMSMDEQSVLVVTYAELKHCLEHAFDEVMTAAGVNS